MQNATKQQMVDFLSERCRVNGRRIPKRKLSALTREDLLRLIRANEESAAGFEAYLRELREPAQTQMEQRSESALAEESEEKTQQLWALVEALAADPTNFLTILQFDRFIGQLQFGQVSVDEINAMCERLTEADPAHALVLLKYNIDQMQLLVKADAEEQSGE